MDHLEKYIRDHREEFEGEEPDPLVWEKLEDMLGQEDSRQVKKRKIFYWSGSFRKWAAVAAVFLLGISFVAFVRAYQVKKEIMQEAIPLDLREAQAYYKAQIHTRIARINSMEPEGVAGDSSLWHLFGEEDAEYARLRDALQENSGNPHVRAAFVEYYRSRLEVLKRIEERLEDHSSFKK